MTKSARLVGLRVRISDVERWLAWGVVVAVVLFKIWLVAGQEVAATFTPHDDLLYLRQASYWFWGHAYDSLAATRPPVFPLWIALVRDTGIPLRLATEGLQVFAYLFFARALARVFRSAAVGALAFAFLLLNPWAIVVDARVSTVSLYQPLLVIAGGTMLHLLTATRVGPFARNCLALAATITLLWHAHAESALAALYLLAFTAVWLGVARLRGDAWRDVLVRATALVLVPVAGVTVVSAVRVELNRRYFGVPVENELMMPGFSRSLLSLAEIGVDRPIPFVSVTHEARRRAYAVSPTFARLRRFFEGPGGRDWSTFAPARMSTPGEINGGWFGWAYRDGAERLGVHTSAQSADAFYGAVHEELERAFARGELKRRPFSILGPEWRRQLSWLPLLGARFLAVLRCEGAAPTLDRDDTDARTIRFFDFMANRRHPTPTHERKQVFRASWAQLWSLYGDAYNVLLGWSVLGLLAGIAGWRALRQDAPAAAAALVLLLLVTARMALLTLVEWNGCPGDGPAYLFPVAGLSACALLSIGFVGLRLSWRRLTRHATAAPEESDSARRTVVPSPAAVATDCDVSVVIPCRNEAETLAGCIRAARQGLEALGLPGEVVVADNGSTDDSALIAAALGARIVTVTAPGYGSALRHGIASARGRFVVMGDADGSYDFSALAPFVARLAQGDDLVMGCRLPRGGGTILPGAMPWKNRWLGVPALSFLGRVLLGTRISDFHCGLRAVTKDAFERMALRTSGMEFASEMIGRAALLDMKVTEVPITLHPDRRSRRSHLRPWRDGCRHLQLMFRLAASRSRGATRPGALSEAVD